MTVRQRITLLVAGAGFLASMLFSIAIFYELIEQPLDMVDAELKSAAHLMATEYGGQTTPSAPPDIQPPHAAIATYWVLITDLTTDKILYESETARLIPLPRVAAGEEESCASQSS